MQLGGCGDGGGVGGGPRGLAIDIWQLLTGNFAGSAGVSVTLGPRRMFGRLEHRNHGSLQGCPNRWIPWGLHQQTVRRETAQGWLAS